jgi:hypothetical protein
LARLRKLCVVIGRLLRLRDLWRPVAGRQAGPELEFFMAVEGISWSGIVLRVALAIGIVLVTFNPSGTSVFHWLAAPPYGITAVKAFAGVALLIAWILCLRTAYVALGALGLILGCLLLGSFVWVLVDMDVLHHVGSEAMVWIGLVVFGAVLGFGLSWSLIRARTTGQIEVQ